MNKTNAIKLLAIDGQPENLTTLIAVVQYAIPQALVLTAQNGPDGIELAAAEDPDVILLDIDLPGMDGFEVCRRLKADNRIKDIPVVFLSALMADTASRVKALEAGSEGFLTQPLETTELIAQIRAMTKVKAANRSQRTEKERLEALVAERRRMHELKFTEHHHAEESLLQADEIFKTLQMGLYVYELENPADDSSLRMVAANEATGKLIGIAPDELIGKYIDEIFPALRGLGLPKRFADIVRTGKASEFEDFYYADDRVLQSAFAVKAFPLPNHRIGIAFDSITERKQAEEALRASQEKYRMLTENIKDVAWILDTDTLYFTYVSPSVTRLRGYTPEEIIAKPLEASLEEFQRAMIKNLLKQRVADFLSGRITEVDFFTEEVLQPCKDGTAVWTEVITHYLRDPATGKVVLQGVTREITKRKQAEEALRESKELHEQLASDSRTIAWRTDPDGLYTFISAAVETILGYRQDEIVGKLHFYDLHPEEGREDFKEMAFAVIQRQGDLSKLDNPLQAKDGSIVWVMSYVRPILDADGVIKGYRGSDRDITEHLRGEEDRAVLAAKLQQAQKMESVGRLAGGVAHDFNNLLMGIMGYAEMCKSEVVENSEASKWLDEIIRETERSANLTRQLLAFARKQTVAPHVLDLNAAVGNMLKMLRRLIGENIDLVWMPGAKPWSVKMDPSQVDQILANLCVNARDAIGGAGRITIETDNVSVDADFCKEYAEAVPGSYVMLVASDDGCGMDHETLKNIFEPFFTTKPTGEGTGLGLATVYGIVKQNNGFLNVFSELGKGTTFRIYLPRDTSVKNEAAEAATKAAVLGGTETILLVEDETAIRTIMCMVLKKLGYTVIPAESPAEALGLIETHRDGIDLMITDVVMPGMSGRDLAEKLAPDYPSMKILYMSGYTADIIAHRGVLDEGVHFLGKPVGCDTLAQKVREVLG